MPKAIREFMRPEHLELDRPADQKGLSPEIQMKLEDKSVIMRREPPAKVMECHGCKMAWRIESFTPKLMQGLPSYCPMCGSQNVTTDEAFIEDKWFYMAARLGLKPGIKASTLLKRLMDMWDPYEYRYFKDYVASVMEEARGNTSEPARSA